MSAEKTRGEVDVSSTPDLSTREIESQGFDNVANKKLLRKLDWHIIPFMSLIYLLSVGPRTIVSRKGTDALQMLPR
jgi:hypothetical protein